MTTHYQEKILRIKAESENNYGLIGNAKLDGYAQRIMKTINNYEGRVRSGDHYVRAIFDCLLIYYIDKFGYVEISRAIEKIFIWAYSLRLNMQVVQLAGMDNYVLENNLFKLINEATRPADFINSSLHNVTTNRSTKTAEIETLFREMRFYE
jgi:hypothetical protein